MKFKQNMWRWLFVKSQDDNAIVELSIVKQHSPEVTASHRGLMRSAAALACLNH